MKHTAMIIGILALLLCAATVLAACGKPDDPIPVATSGTTSGNDSGPSSDPADVTSGDETSPVDPREPLTLIAGGTTEYVLVFPEIANAETHDAVNRFRSLFYERTGLMLATEDDYLRAGQTHEWDVCRILVGKTNYEASQELFAEMGYYDYRITVSDTHLVIAALCEDGYDQLFDWIENNLFRDMTGTGSERTLMLEPVTFGGTVPNDAVTDWTVCGNALSAYRIVYHDANLLPYVNAFRDSLAKKSGHWLEVVRDTDADAAPCEILIGGTDREESAQVDVPDAMSYTVSVIGGKIVVRTGGEQSLSLVAERFVDLLADGGDSVLLREGDSLSDLFYDDPFNFNAPKNSDLRIVSANVMADLKNYSSATEDYPIGRRAEIFFGMLELYQPTVVGVQEFCKNWEAAFHSYRYAGDWGYVTYPNARVSGENVFSGILYRKNLLTLLDSGMTYYSAYNNGRCRCVTWAKLRVNATGREFYFVSTHWDGAETENTYQQVAELSDFVNGWVEAGYPVFTTGDFNSNEYSGAFRTYLKNTKALDAMYAAGTRLNVKGSWHGWAEDTASAGSCDHITAIKETVDVLQFETLMYNDQIYASDHAWLAADIAFR